eukprot:3498660-Heterocapsa_arctica.AAC.1
MARCSFGRLEQTIHIRNDIQDNEGRNCEWRKIIKMSGMTDYDKLDECGGHKRVHKRGGMFGKDYN